LGKAGNGVVVEENRGGLGGGCLLAELKRGLLRGAKFSGTTPGQTKLGHDHML